MTRINHEKLNRYGSVKESRVGHDHKANYYNSKSHAYDCLMFAKHLNKILIKASLKDKIKIRTFMVKAKKGKLSHDEMHLVGFLIKKYD